MSRQSRPAEPHSLIATKTVKAPFDRRFVSRIALFDTFLDSQGEGAIASIVATAGSGKSVLMAELNDCLVAHGATTCWLSLDREDDCALTVAAYLISALHAGEPRWFPDGLSLLRNQADGQVESLLERLLATLSRITSPLTLFFDDFHHLHDPPLLAFFNRLIAHMPASMRLVIASRTQLPLELGRLRLRGRLFELRQATLSFDMGTMDRVLQQVHGLRLGVGELQALHASTEGWASGVQLAALALLRHQGPAKALIDSFSGRDEGLSSYLVESVLSSQPPEVSEFLLLTAPLRRISSALCEAVTERAGGHAMLDQLVRSNLFLIPLDADAQWFRYHHLFAQCLVDQLRRTDATRLRQALSRAARWCEAEELTTEAIQYHLDCENFEHASALIAEHALRLAQREGDHYTMLDWMRRLPASYREQHPEITLGHAWSLAFSQNSHKAMALCNGVEAMLRDQQVREQPPERTAWHRLLAQVTLAVAEATADQLDTCLSRASVLMDRIPAHESFLRAATSNCLSYGHFALGDFDRSAAAAAEAYVLGQRAGAGFATAWADFLHGLADIGRGRLRSAHEHSLRLSSASERGAAHSYAWALAALLKAEIARQNCSFADADLLIDSARFFSSVFGALEPLLLAFRNEAAWLARKGRVGDAREVLMSGQDLALRLDLPRLFNALGIDEVVLRLHAGDTAGAIESADRLRLNDSAASTTPMAPCDARQLRLLHARLRLAQGEATAALRLLNMLQGDAGLDRRSGFWLTVTSVKAVALHQCGQLREARRELGRALTNAELEFHAFPILDAGPALLALLGPDGPGDANPQPLRSQAVLRQRLSAMLLGPASEAIASVATVLVAPVAAIAAPGSPGRPEPITERETQLLRLLDAGLSNKQLAAELVISEGTVKWHLHNVYAKLGVRSRSAATALARAQRLI